MLNYINKDWETILYFHGNCGKGTQGVITKTEAERFCDVAIREEVPKDRILIEPKATTTYENYKYTKKLLINNHLNPSSFLIVGKPYQERRALAIASHNMTLEDYLEYVKNDQLMKIEDVINEMVGEISLIRLTPSYGLQSKQQIPDEVMQSYHHLVEMGYNQYNYKEKTVRSFIDVMIKKGLEQEKNEMEL